MGALASSMLFQPPQRPWEKNANFIPIHTKTRGYTINASLVLAEGAKYTILFSHGNAEDLRQILMVQRCCHKTGSKYTIVRLYWIWNDQ